MKYGSCKHGGNLKSCPECNDISCDSTIKLMEENKIPTAAEFVAKKYEELGQSINHESHMIEFAKMHVKKALETQENKLNSECGRKFFDLTSTYPLENIK